MSTIFYKSARNAMKRKDASGGQNVAAPATPAFVFGTPQLYVTNITVSHGLGYPPVFRFYYEPFKDGIIWPPLTDRSQGQAFNPLNTSQTGPGLIAWVDPVAPYDLHLQLFYPNNTLTGTYPVYYVIYKDFQL